MPVTITFHKVSEKKPEHGQSIIWLQNTSSFGYQGFNPREVDVEYQWTEYFLADRLRLVMLSVMIMEMKHLRPKMVCFMKSVF